MGRLWYACGVLLVIAMMLGAATGLGLLAVKAVDGIDFSLQKVSGWTAPDDPQLQPEPPGSPWNPIFLSNATLPTPRWGTSAVWIGDYALIFGGTNLTTRFDDVLRYDPVRDEIITMQSRFPTGLASSAAVQVGDHAFIFGGFTATDTYSDQIYRYDPSTDILETAKSVLPHPVTSSSAVWTGDKVILFGGYNEAIVEPAILIYDPIADTIAPSNASFPRPWVLDPRGLSIATASWDGNYAYVLGGYSPRGWTAQVLRYDPQLDQIEYLPRSGSDWLVEPWTGTGSFDGQGALPSRMGYAPSLWDGQQLLIFGGSLYRSQTGSEAQATDGILSFRPDNRVVAMTDLRLPSPLSGASAAWSGHVGFLFGGGNGTTQSDQVVVYAPDSASREAMLAQIGRSNA